MTPRRRTVRAAANFRRNLDRIEAFLVAANAPQEFESLVNLLSEEIAPALERFPEMGADFLGRAPLSAEGKALFAKAAALLGHDDSLRQLVTGDYIVLYAVLPQGLYLLAIRHHRELPFDFAGHWP